MRVQRNIVVRNEHTIAITEDGPAVLTNMSID